MKLLFQILFFTWFNLSATPPFSKVAIPNYEISYSKTGNQNLETEVKIGILNFARSNISENSFYQKAVLWDSYVLENRAREANVRVVQGAGKFLDDIVLPMKADFPKLKFNKIGDDAFEILDGAGKKWGTVYKDKIVCPARTQIGTAGNPILNKAVLVKNMRYEVDGIIYQSDELGRVLTTTADLDDIARVRLGNQQIRAVDVKDGVRGVDQGGHIVGSRFFGPGEQINLYPQSANLNQGPWKTMENSWADAMVAGKDVKIEVKAIFEGSSKRPMKFEVEHWIDGKYKLEKFDNL